MTTSQDISKVLAPTCALLLLPKVLPRSPLNPATRTADARDALPVRVSGGPLLGEMTQVVARQKRRRCQMADVAGVGLRLVLRVRVAPVGIFRLVQRGAVLEEVVCFHFTHKGMGARAELG